MRIHHVAIGFGLALFLAPGLLLARPMTQDESRCFEASEAVYQAATPWEWGSVEPCPLAELAAEVAMVECLASCGVDDPSLYDWSNYICQ